MSEPVRILFGGELDASSAPIWRERLAEAARSDLILDLSDATFVDSTFVNALFRLARDGQQITVVDCPPNIVRIMSLAGLAGVAHVIPLRREELLGVPDEPEVSAAS